MKAFAEIGNVVITKSWVMWGTPGKKNYVYAAWEPTTISDMGDGSHHQITHIDGRDGCYGKVGTKSIPAEINALPFGEERIKAVQKWYRGQKERAICLIYEACPETADGQVDMSMGEIILSLD